jgi:sugar lactone lactonase YvrE
MLYWVDINAGDLYRWNPHTNTHQVFHLGFSIGCLGLRAAGGLVMATKQGFGTWNEKDGFKLLVNPIADKPHMRFNDGAVDPRGSFWAGTMVERRVEGHGPEGTLYRLDPDGSVHVMLTGLRIPNGMGWSLDHKTMYFTDTPDHTIYAFDYDLATGSISNRRPFVVIPETDGNPDGMTVDSEGFIWCAHWGGWKVTRHDLTGKVVATVPVPVERPSSVAFGGVKLDELFISTADQGISDDELKRQPFSGALLRCRPGVTGLREFEYAG